MSWPNEPENYEPIPNVDAHLRALNAPDVNSAEFKMVAMHQSGKSPQEVGLTLLQARELIEARIVPMEFYPAVLAVARGN